MRMVKNEALRRAVQLCTIASDWNLDEVEIDGEMIPIHELKQEFQEALDVPYFSDPPRPDSDG